MLASRRITLVACWALAAALLVVAVLRARGGSYYGMDFFPNYYGALNLRLHGDPYLPVPHTLAFVYPPSAALLLWPLSYVGVHAARGASLLIGVTSIVVIGVSSARVVGRRWHGYTAAGFVCALAVFALPVATVSIGNFSLVMAAGLALALALAVSGRMTAAAVVLGVTIAVKPAVVLALLVFVAYRRWRSLGVAVAVPLVLNLVTLPLLAHPTDFVSKVLPPVLHGDTLRLTANVSVGAAVQRGGGGVVLQDVARLAVLLGVLGVLWLSLRAEQDVKIAVIGTVPVLALALLSRTDEVHYTLVAVALLALMLWCGPWLSRLAAAVVVALIALPGAHGMTAQLLAIAAAAPLALANRATQPSRRSAAPGSPRRRGSGWWRSSPAAPR